MMWWASEGITGVCVCVCGRGGVESRTWWERSDLSCCAAECRLLCCRGPQWAHSSALCPRRSRSLRRSGEEPRILLIHVGINLSFTELQLHTRREERKRERARKGNRSRKRFPYAPSERREGRSFPPLVHSEFTNLDTFISVAPFTIQKCL